MVNSSTVFIGRNVACNTIHLGDRVRLREGLAKSIMRDKKNADWLNRRGVVGKMPIIPGNSVTIKWDDRRTLDPWPQAALVIVTEQNSLNGHL